MDKASGKDAKWVPPLDGELGAADQLRHHGRQEAGHLSVGLDMLQGGT